MQDSTVTATDTIHYGPVPVSQAFSGGALMMEQSPVDSSQEDNHDGDSVVTDVVAVICILAVLFTLKKMVNVLPSMLSCLFRWKEALDLEYNVKLGRDRNIIFLVMILPACLLATRYSLYAPDFISTMDISGKFFSYVGILIGYLLVRAAADFATGTRKIDKSAYSAAKMLFLTFFSLGTLFCIVTAGLLSFTELPYETVRSVILYISGALYLLLIFRKAQIFSHYCSVLSTILYLCSLEIVPTGLLVASAMIL